MSSISASDTKECGCKGIRTCLICQSQSPMITNSNRPADNNNTADTINRINKVEVHRDVYEYCVHCRKAWLKKACLEPLHQRSTDVAKHLDDNVSTAQSCCHDVESDMTMELPGISITEHFVTQVEERDLDKAIAFTPFMKSQSGRQKQDFGPKVNFKKKKLKLGSFNGLPSYSRFLYERMKACKLLMDFEPVEMCNLEYTSDRGAHIDPHYDDIWVWGERLVTLNLLTDSILSFTHDSHPDLVIQVPLLRRSLIVVSGPARYEWKHSIDPEHISGRRLAMTFRELADEFTHKGVRGEEGQELLKLALSFKGCAVGCAS